MKEQRIKLSTEDGQNELTTNKITGILHGVVIKSLEDIAITITSELDYIVFHKANFKGIEYLPIVVKGRTNNFNEFHLNEKLIIRVIGLPNTEIELILRYD